MTSGNNQLSRGAPVPRSWRRVLRAAWTACVASWLAGLACLASPSFAQPIALVELRQALRVDADGSTRTVTLPDTVISEEKPAPVLELRYQLEVDLGPAPTQAALYLSGLAAHVRIAVNGRVLSDSIRDPLPPRPRGAGRMRLVDIPEPLLVGGLNRIDITVKAVGFTSLSPVTLGPPEVLRDLRDRKAFGLVVGPTIVAAIVGCLGLSVLLLFARRPTDTLYGYFGFAALVWGLHTLWSVLPDPLLPGVHYGIWWTSLYSLVVSALTNFSLRFAGYDLPRVERALWLASAAAPPVFYAAHALDGLNTAAELWRLGMVVVAFAGLAAVAAKAWRHRSADSALLVIAGWAAAALGLRDWLVARNEGNNLPIYWAPYAALPFVILVTWFLIDRFVRTTESLEAMNRDLESRVERKSAELVQALEHMRRARDAAEAANRAKTSFLAAASHDLRQPMHALGLYLAALREQPLAPTQQELAARMLDSASALESMFGAMLDISRMDAGAVAARARVFELQPLLQRLVSEFGASADAQGLRLALRVSVATAGLRARTDPALLERVLRNLLVNALKYTRRGGVLVTCRLRRGPPALWRIEVWDTGPGIPHAERSRIFEEFYQVGNPERDRMAGLGLGLSIVRRLTELLRLPLSLVSQPGKGSRFGVDVLATPDPVSPLPVEPAPGSVAGTGVAVIDDDPEVRASMRTLLTSWGCAVAAGSDAAEVLNGAQREGITLDAVVADLRLRGEQDGITEVALLRARLGRSTPALLVSGDSAPERLALMELSGLPWLTKPVPASKLRSWLGNVVGLPAEETT